MNSIDIISSISAECPASEHEAATPIFRQNWQKKRNDLIRSTIDSIRHEATQTRLGKSTLFSKHILYGDTTHLLIDLLGKATSLDYQHLTTKHHNTLKLMVSNACLNTMQDSTSISVPFVFRLPLSMQDLPADDVTSRIQKALKRALGDDLHYWLTFEYANRSGNSNRHLNGEILLDADKICVLIEALNSLYRTPADKAAISFATRVLSSSRQKQAHLYGIGYSVLNWASYATKERSRIKYDQRDGRRKKERIVYISRPLKQSSKRYHHECIHKKSSIAASVSSTASTSDETTLSIDL